MRKKLIHQSDLEKINEHLSNKAVSDMGQTIVSAVLSIVFLCLPGLIELPQTVSLLSWALALVFGLISYFGGKNTHNHIDF